MWYLAIVIWCIITMQCEALDQHAIAIHESLCQWTASDTRTSDIMESRTTKRYTALNVSHLIDVILMPALHVLDTKMIFIKGDRSLVPQVKAEVRDHTLYLALPSEAQQYGNRVEVVCLVHDIREITVKGSGRLMMDEKAWWSPLHIDQLSITVYNYGRVILHSLDAGVLHIYGSGHASLVLEGTVDRLEGTMRDKSILDANELIVETMDVSIGENAVIHIYEG